jgi:hypothetical protein
VLFNAISCLTKQELHTLSPAINMDELDTWQHDQTDVQPDVHNLNGA